MDIRIIHKNEKLDTLIIRGRSILEVEKHYQDDIGIYDLSVYDPDKNTLEEISPELKKVDIVPVYNCIWKSEDIYFGTCKADDENNLLIQVYKYDTGRKTTEFLHALTENNQIFVGTKTIKLFALDENLFLVQTEVKKDNSSQKLMGNIEFNLCLYNTETGSQTDIIDQNLLNNGVNVIIPIDEEHFLIKTGYSFLEDSRISGSSESEALIESVFYGPKKSFIDSLNTGSATNGFRLLATAYFDKCILSPMVKDDYIYFIVYDYENRLSEVSFYNYVTDDILVCKNENADVEDLENAYIINNVPYIRHEKDDKTQFINLITSDIDCVFYDEKFVGLSGGLFIFHKEQGNHNNIRIYRHPKLDLVYEEKGYINNFCNDRDNYFIYVSDEQFI